MNRQKKKCENFFTFKMSSHTVAKYIECAKLCFFTFEVITSPSM